MTSEFKARGGKQTTEVISDDPKYAIFKGDQCRSHRLEVWIEDINGNGRTPHWIKSKNPNAPAVKA
jgi:hypothetical protein